MNMFSLFLFPFFCLSVYLPLNLLSSSRYLMHHIPLPHFYPHCLSKYLSPSVFFSFQFVQSGICWKEAFSLLGVCGAAVVNCVFTVAPISCHQAWRKAYRGDLKAHSGIWKAILMKELETIMVSVKCREMWPVSEHKPFDLQHVLTLVVLSKVWTGAPLVSAGFYRGTSCLLSYFYPLPVLTIPPQTNNTLYYEKLPYLSMKFGQFIHFSPQPESMYMRFCPKKINLVSVEAIFFSWR